ncbi:MAG: iron-containing alcohol dehydrogenase [Myxococcota bacterium]
MKDFHYFNPTRIVFGRTAIDSLSDLVPKDGKVLLTYGGGSIKRHGIHEKVVAALEGRQVLEMGGIEANPDYETLLRGCELARKEEVSFLLAVGGGSVVDGTKFIAAAARYEGEDPWRIIETHGKVVKDALPLGVVLTLPAAGSESNANAVISRRELGLKMHFRSEAVFPRFALLDPETTYTLPADQLRNGVADAFVHVLEQYATFPAKAPLQSRQAEAILHTLIEQARAVLASPPDYYARAGLMWCANQALNGLIGLGMPQDWSTHRIGHELTAIYGLDHAASLVVVLPGLLRHQIDSKRAMLEQYGRRIFDVPSAEAAIERTEAFFRDIGMKTRLSEHEIDAAEAAAKVGERLAARGERLGEHKDLDAASVSEILLSRA